MDTKTITTASQAYEKAKLINNKKTRAYGKEMWLKHVEPHIISTINKGEFGCNIENIGTSIDWEKVATFGRNLGFDIRTNVCTNGNSYVLVIKFPEPQREIDYLEGNRG